MVVILHKVCHNIEYNTKAGSVFIVGLVIVALFMISNTIKITITARSTEISIMRMVGASNWYIRIPFMLEGMLIGLFGALFQFLFLFMVMERYITIQVVH